MGLITDIAKLVTDVYQLWQTRDTADIERAKTLFSRYIEPSYKLLKEVHSDYVELYLEVEVRARLAETTPDDLFAWFSQARTRRQADRSELRAIKFPNVSDNFKSWDTRKIEVLDKELDAYISALKSYFYPTFEWQSETIVTEERLLFLTIWNNMSYLDKIIYLNNKMLNIKQKIYTQSSTVFEEKDILAEILSTNLTNPPPDDYIIKEIENLDLSAKEIPDKQFLDDRFRMIDDRFRITRSMINYWLFAMFEVRICD